MPKIALSKVYIILPLLFLAELLLGVPSIKENSDIFTLADADMSKNILASIFGKINYLDLSDTSLPFAELIRIFNTGLLFFVGGYAAYSLTTSVINYSQHGGPMEAQRYSPWHPARVVIGAGMLVPTSSGYSMMQVIVMWVVLHGAGLADAMWSKTVDSLEKYGVSVTEEADNSAAILPKVFDQGSQDYRLLSKSDQRLGLLDFRAIAACLVLQENAARADGDQDTLFDWWPDSDLGCDVKNGFCVGSSKNKTLCGKYNFGTDNQAINRFFTQTLTESIASLKLALSGYYDPELSKVSFYNDANDLSQLLKSYIKNSQELEQPEPWADKARDEGWLVAGVNYKRFVSKKTTVSVPLYDILQIPNFFPKTSNQQPADFSQAKEYLQKMANDYLLAKNIQPPAKEVINLSDAANKALSTAMDQLAEYATKTFTANYSKTIFSDISHIGGVPLTIAKDNALLMNAKVVDALLGTKIAHKDKWYDPVIDPASQESTLYTNLCRDGATTSCLQDPYTGIIGGIKEFANGSRVEPLAAMTLMGNNLMIIAVEYWLETARGFYDISMKLVPIYAAVSAGISAAIGLLSVAPIIGDSLSAVGKQAGKLVGMLFQLDLKSMTGVLMVTVTVAALFFVAGAMLGIYLPFVPYIVFLFCVIGWVIAVIEAMIAAPIIALGVTHPQGHDLLGKAEQAMMLLLGVFVRPAAIMIGFIIAIYLLYIAWLMLNIGFAISFASYLTMLSDYTGFIIRSLIFAALLIMYTYMLSSIVHQVFGLTYKVPEQLMRWIGLAPEVTGVSQMLGEVRQSTQSGISQATEGAKQSVQPPSIDPSMPGRAFKDLGKDAAKVPKKAKKIWNRLTKPRSNDE